MQGTSNSVLPGDVVDILRRLPSGNLVAIVDFMSPKVGGEIRVPCPDAVYVLAEVLRTIPVADETGAIGCLVESADDVPERGPFPDVMTAVAGACANARLKLVQVQPVSRDYFKASLKRASIIIATADVRPDFSYIIRKGEGEPTYNEPPMIEELMTRAD